MPAAPRRRLAARVYWVRRAAVLVTVLALGFAVGRLVVRHGNDAVAASQTSRPAGSSSSPGPTPTVSVAPPLTTGQTTGQSTGQSTAAAPSPTASVAPTLAAPTSVPTGACSDDQITVTPAVTEVTGGGQVALPVDLTTTTSGACTWRVSSASLVLKISKGSNRIWSSQDCPTAVAAQDVVVRPASEQPTQVPVTWGGRHSVQGCVTGQAWADPGSYVLTAASLGGAPAQSKLAVVAPPQPVVTKTVKPKKQKKPTAPASTPPG